MTKDDILDRIILDDGHCGSWARRSVCEICPLSKLKQRPDGTYLSCVEALEAQYLSYKDADAIYKEVALRLKLDEAIDDLLVDDGEKWR